MSWLPIENPLVFQGISAFGKFESVAGNLVVHNRFLPEGEASTDPTELHVPLIHYLFVVHLSLPTVCTRPFFLDVIQTFSSNPGRVRGVGVLDHFEPVPLGLKI
jgi:hypothetical protein